jgi:hypothetical protein
MTPFPTQAPLRLAPELVIEPVRCRIVRPDLPPTRASAPSVEDDPSGPKARRSGAEVETDLASLQSQTRLKRLSGPRREALEHRAATLLQERLVRARRDSLAGDRLPDRKLAPALPAAAAMPYVPRTDNLLSMILRRDFDVFLCHNSADKHCRDRSHRWRRAGHSLASPP